MRVTTSLAGHHPRPTAPRTAPCSMSCAHAGECSNARLGLWLLPALTVGRCCEQRSDIRQLRRHDVLRVHRARPAPQSPRRAPTPHPALVQDEGKSFYCTSRPVRSKCPSLTRAPDYKCPCDNDDHQPFGAGGELYPRYLNLQDGRVLLTFTVRSDIHLSTSSLRGWPRGLPLAGALRPHHPNDERDDAPPLRQHHGRREHRPAGCAVHRPREDLRL